MNATLGKTTLKHGPLSKLGGLTERRANSGKGTDRSGRLKQSQNLKSKIMLSPHSTISQSGTPRDATQAFIPPSQLPRITNPYIKQPFKQTRYFNFGGRPEQCGPFLELAATPQASRARTPSKIEPFTEVDPSVNLADETAYATYQLQVALRNSQPAQAKKVATAGHLRQGRLQLLRPVQKDGPSINYCLGMVADKRINRPPTAVRRRGALIATLRQNKGVLLASEKASSGLGRPRVATAESVHRTSIASSEDRDQIARIQRLDEELNSEGTRKQESNDLPEPKEIVRDMLEKDIDGGSEPVDNGPEVTVPEPSIPRPFSEPSIQTNPSEHPRRERPKSVRFSREIQFD